MTLEEAKEKMFVAYIPNHAAGDISHADVETGLISSKNDKFIFVKFEPQLSRFGWKGTTSQACSPENLTVLDK